MVNMTFSTDNMEDLRVFLAGMLAAIKSNTTQAAADLEEVTPDEVAQEDPADPEEPIDAAAQEETALDETVEVLTEVHVRAALTAKSKAGKKEEVKGLLAKYGAGSISTIAPENYADIMKEVEAL